MNNPDMTQIIITIGSGVFVLAVIVWILVFLRRVQQGRGPLGSVLQQNRELVKESVGTAREGLQVERELLTAQKETNELMKQMLARPGAAKSKLIGFVATQNPAGALKFYAGTLGLTLVSDDPFAMVFDVNGTMLRVQKVHELLPAKHTVLGWDVPDIGAQVKNLTGKGVRFDRYDGLAQDELGVWTTPSGAKVAWFKDPDGNVLSLTQFQP